MVVRQLVPALMLGLLALSAPARADDALTLEAAVRQALSNNEAALKAPLRVDAAEGALEKARGAFLPTLVASGQGTLQDKQAPPFGAGANLTLNQPIFAPSAYPLYAQARH